LGAVLYVDRSPGAYFKEVDAIEPTQVRELQRRLWNHSVAPVLVVASPKEVHVYSGRALPAKPDEDPAGGNRLVKILDRTSQALELCQLVTSIETGQIYADHPECFNRDKAVDRYLLGNLDSLRYCLTEGDDSLDSDPAHALLTRLIFTCYLIEREIVKGRDFTQPALRELNKEKGLRGLVKDREAGEARKLLYELFRQLKGTFNGSMFEADLDAEEQKVRDDDVRSIQKFLNGDDVKHGQQTLGFWAYDFSIIPIETISAIYEDFIEAEGAKKQQETTKAEKKRRKLGAYYTPPHLAEMVLDVATEGWPSLLGKRILDPACGSGIFLVAAFNRMAEEWRRKNPNQRNGTRYKKLCELLENHMFGIDVSDAACRVACFSLYLALLDQLEPRDIKTLEGKGPKLPKLLLAKEQKPSPSRPRNILCRNFFLSELPISKNHFDLVVGNPPWVSRGKGKDAEFLKWRRLNPKLLVPGGQIAHGFMWEAPKYLDSSGRGALLLPSSAFLNETTNKFQQCWLKEFSVVKLVQLSDMRYLLFSGAKHPAVIARFSGAKPAPETAVIDYEVPKVGPFILRGGPVHVLEQDRKGIRLSRLLDAAEHDLAPRYWKARLWGTPRDLRLLDRLTDLDPLGKMAGKPEENKRFIKGVGLQPYRETDAASDLPVIEASWSDTDRFLSARSPFSLVVVQKHLTRMPENLRKLRRSPDGRLFEPPMVLVTKGSSKRAFCNLAVYFRDALHSIKARDPKDANLLRFLAGVMNSKLSKYFFFHTAANWGTERLQVYSVQLLGLPFPPPERAPEPERASEIVCEVAERIGALQAQLSKPQVGADALVERTISKMEPLIYEYYDIDEFERMLIEDTVNVFEPSSTPTTPDAKPRTLNPCTKAHRKTYASVLCEMLNTWARPTGQHVSASCLYGRSAGAAIVTITKSRRGSSSPYDESEAPDKLAHALKRISNQLPLRERGFLYGRGLRVFDGDTLLHIVKPLTYRSWTRTAALNDADEIAADILKRT